MKKLAAALTVLALLLTLLTGLAAAEGNSVTVHSVVYNNVPDGSEGLTFTSIDSVYRRVTVEMRNDTDAVIGSLSTVGYKLYNKDNVVIDTGIVFASHMNPGEKCRSRFYFTYDTVRVDFEEINIREGDEGEDPSQVETQTVRNMNFNIPYKREGIEMNVINVSGNTFEVLITNNTDIPLSDSSTIAYKAYSKDGEVLDSSYVWMESMNPGETCKRKVYVPNKSKTVIFGAVELKKGKMREEVATQKIGKMEVNKLPVIMDTVAITDIKILGTKKATLTIENQGSTAISHSSHFEYSCFNADGLVLWTNVAYLEDMNPGEKCTITLWLQKKTTKLLFTNPIINEGEIVERPALTKYSKLEMNTLPYTSEGLTITNFEVSGRRIIVTVKNDTGKPVSNPRFEYKCSNKKGEVIDSGSLYLPDMNAGESCTKYCQAITGTCQIIFGTAEYSEGVEFNKDIPTVNCGRADVSLPYEYYGVIISSVVCKDKHFECIIENHTGTTLDSYQCSIPYRCYDADGNVMSAGSIYLEKLNNNEACKTKTYHEKGVKLILFGEPSFR